MHGCHSKTPSGNGVCSVFFEQFFGNSFCSLCFLSGGYWIHNVRSNFCQKILRQLEPCPTLLVWSCLIFCHQHSLQGSFDWFPHLLRELYEVRRNQPKSSHAKLSTGFHVFHMASLYMVQFKVHFFFSGVPGTMAARISSSSLFMGQKGLPHRALRDDMIDFPRRCSSLKNATKKTS